jgi:hypothetical protein
MIRRHDLHLIGLRADDTPAACAEAAIRKARRTRWRDWLIVLACLWAAAAYGHYRQAQAENCGAQASIGLCSKSPAPAAANGQTPQRTERIPS